MRVATHSPFPDRVSVEIKNSTFYNNGQSIAILAFNTTVNIVNSIFSNNSFNSEGGTFNVNYSLTNEDPQFINPENGDFNLQPSSPCIDTGDPDLDGDGIDFDGPDNILGNEDDDTDDQDPDGSRLDMGAYPFEHIYGCTDLDACSNYNELADSDDGSCLYNDCAGECGGDALEDNCGTCDTDSSNASPPQSPAQSS
jgi:hypothetical protein